MSKKLTDRERVHSEFALPVDVSIVKGEQDMLRDQRESLTHTQYVKPYVAFGNVELTARAIEF